MALYTELWHACAGPLVTVPRENERVYYFPQGHIEQVTSLFFFFIFNFLFSLKSSSGLLFITVCDINVYVFGIHELGGGVY